ncbi:sugar phosphate isomerase/epimerase family protein [Propionibacterium australiense]|uniref:Sugar phosphate isomerase/epimerase n=1 Tax=Propionibacterium australiense TaxID=119981 RepID=A0A383S655_9ACTN|nr:TIM barrel protein [Propionibacterium australiense]RLP08970.1 sugar phosphate isomerase/epimerase [Propionibacterium australiense]RLP09097.1 sugar phosphate isomerase/epimerase [Propionibacterium australiense]SYZ33470.1 Xylose isomerase-like TIM barrel [Propionibacterium australiense]VEH91779.1 Xylose isomerase-like TIM barrel [Propionibacterium australiense]
MGLGIGTYALFWEWSEAVGRPIDLAGMLDRAAGLGCDVFQICDYPLIETMDAAQLTDVAAQASELGLALELGTRGTRGEQLNAYLDIAETMGVRMLRSMVRVGAGEPTLDESLASVRGLLGRLHEDGVSIAFETYEQLPSARLVQFVTDVDDPHVGICLDPANCVAGLELPGDVIDRCAPYTLNLHVKDFAFTRQAGWVGFIYAGAPMGEGLLDFDAEMKAVRPLERGINMVVEHWLTWQGDPQSTVALERQWTRQSLDYIRTYIDNQGELNHE